MKLPAIPAALAGFVVLGTIAAEAGPDDITLLGVGGGSVVYAAGPGNVSSSFTAWYGLRGYSVAYASGTNKALNIRRNSDNHTCDLFVATTGFLGATTGCSTSGDNGVSADTFCVATTCFATELYDQSGNACHVTQATAANQPQFLQSGGPFSGITNNSLSFNGTSHNLSGSCTQAALPTTTYAWANPSSSSATLVMLSTSTANNGIRFSDASGFLNITYGAVGDFAFSSLAMSTSTWYLAATQAVIVGNNPVGILQQAGGSQTTQTHASIPGSYNSPSPNTFEFGHSTFASQFWSGSIEELGIASVLLSAANMTSIYNQH